MLRGTPQTKAKSGRVVKYSNISAEAAQLGVHRIHLWQVLEGRRHSRSLIHRYRALKTGGAR